MLSVSSFLHLLASMLMHIVISGIINEVDGLNS